MSANKTLTPTLTSIEEFIALEDDELYVALQRVMENRVIPWGDLATDEHGWPERAAKLAVIRHILCN